MILHEAIALALERVNESPHLDVDSQKLHGVVIAVAVAFLRGLKEEPTKQPSGGLTSCGGWWVYFGDLEKLLDDHKRRPLTEDEAHLLAVLEKEIGALNRRTMA